MQAVLEIFLLAVGVPCIIVLIAAENAIVTLIVMIYAVLIALPTFLLATLLCVLFIPCVVGAVADHFLNGMIRVLRGPKTIQRPGGTILHSNTTT
jgi:uncharacterized membrane protein YciS (DUF1049 family)